MCNRELLVIHVDNNFQVDGYPEEATYGNPGSAELYCDENGEWSGQPPKCIEIKCTVPPIENGHVPDRNIQEYKEHDVLRFMCNSQYKPTEDRPSRCTKVGIKAEWTPTPACEPITCKLTLPPLEGTRYESVSRNVFLPGETLRVICGEKYWISNNQESAVTTCDVDGEWTIRPVCTEVVCSNQRPQHVYNWEVSYWGNHQSKMGETKRYSCETGFKSTDGATQATCTRNGWTPNPLCQEITCDRKNIPEADVISENKQRYRYYEQVRYRCKEGYQGQFTLTCRGDGWIGNPRCTEITCDRKNIREADVISENKQRYRYYEQVWYRCKEGYQGQFTLTCRGEGWIGNPRCTEITCDRKNIQEADVISENKQRYRYDEQVQYRCKDGDQGQFTLTCRGEGWIGNPRCTDTCPKPEVPHGFAVGPYNNTIYYTCNKGFKLFTNKGWWAEAKCNDNGLQQCIENTECGETPVIPNGKLVTPQRQNLRHIQARITCNAGYSSQSGNLPCRGGKWIPDNISPKDICTPTAKHCKPPPKVENAVVRTSYQKEYLSNSAVTYQCRDGYYMEGEYKILCNNGKWEKKNVTCTQITCDKKNIREADVISENKQRYRYNEQVQYHCKEGYQGQFTLTCRGEGWIGRSTCTEITCDRKNIREADVISENKQTYRYNEQVQYRCKDGDQGQFTLTCRGEGWIGNPRCTAHDADAHDPNKSQ
ncbi:complement factor H-like [Sander vitreus]